MKKRLLALLLCFVFSLSLLPATAWADDTGAPDVTQTQDAAENTPADDPENLTEQPVLSVTAPPAKTSYVVGETLDTTGMAISATYSDGTVVPLAAEDYTVSPTGSALSTITELTISYHNATCTQPVTVTVPLEGEGTQASPYLLNSAETLTTLSETVAAGESYAGKYFRLTENLTLPQSWAPLGIDKTHCFSGSIDGNNTTLTVPEGGLPLIGFPKEAEVHDLNIFGKRIESSGLVDIYTTGIKGVTAITIDNVTLKSGTQTLKSGFISGYAPGDFPAVIRNCMVEEGVVIGYDGAQSKVGSFGGDFNGTVINCVSYATVKGANYVGGIVGSKGQSMGDCKVFDCAFYGTVEASGDYAGGIVGRGYSDATGPNSPCVTIRNCYSTGTITANNYVGGIFGGEGGVVQCWPNGIGYIQNNYFAGTVSATGEDAVVGGVIGNMRSLDRYNLITNNYYAEGCGAVKGIGQVELVLAPDSSGSIGSGWGAVNLNGPVYGRDDDPTGAGADVLAKAVTAGELTDGTLVRLLNAGRNSRGDWTQGENGPVFGTRRHIVDMSIRPALTSGKLSAAVGGADALAGRSLVLTYSDGTTETVSADLAARENYLVTDEQAGKSLGASLIYNRQQVMFQLDVKAGSGTPTTPTTPSDDTVTVRFTLLGDTVHGAEATHTLRDENLSTWIAETEVTVPKNSTVMTVLGKILTQKGYSWVNDDRKNGDGNYIQSITSPEGVMLAEFTNGKLSGWMYTLNGEHPDLGVSEQKAADGDEIVFHYTDDYTRERGSENWTGNSSSGTSGGTAAKPGEKAETTLSPEVEADAKGEASAVIDEKALNNTIADTKTGQADTIVIAPDVKGDASKVSVELPKSGVDNIAKQTDADLKVETGIADITIPQESLKDLAGQSGSKFTVSAEAVKDTDNVKLDIAVDGKSVEKLSGGIAVSVPAKEKNSGNVLVIVNADGTETVVKKSVMDGKTVEALLDGSCTVRVVDNSMRFDDTVNHWSKDAAAFASSHELFSGTSANTFAPDTPMSRAMLATVLYRLEDAVATGSNAFDDVPGGTWYTDAVTWASSAGIVTGTGSGFDPNGNVIREQLATMLYRYAKALGMSTGAAGDLSRFSDGGKTSGWARDAMEWAVGSGLISGKGSGILDPTGSATRAEVAVIMQRLIGLMVK